MRVLVLTQVVPSPGDAGPKIKTYYALKTLAQEHDIEVISFTRSDVEVAAAHDLESWCDRVTAIPLQRQRALEPYYAARGWLSLRPFLVQRDARRTFARAVRERLSHGDIDVLHADQLSMANYLYLARGNRTLTVFDAHNAVWQLVRSFGPRQPTPWRRAGAQVEWRLLRRFETRMARESHLTLAVSADDARALTGESETDINTVVVPIGIEALKRVPVQVRRDATRVLSVATMHYPPNAEAIRWLRDAIWPIVRAADPAVAVDIVGARPPEDLGVWAERDPRVAVHGFVSEVRPLYEDAAMFVVPLRAGSGIRVKILEAMAMGVPVVSTSVGIDGLDVTPNEHLLVADDAASFANAILELRRSFERRQRLAAAARQHVVARYDWRACNRPLLMAYRDLTLSASRSAPSPSVTPGFHAPS